MTPRRILFLAEGQLGDLLLLTPALRAVRESFPYAFLCVLVLDRRTPLRPVVNPSMFDVPLESCPLATNKNVDELILVSRQFLREAKGFDRISGEASLVALLRKSKFDTVVCTFPEDRFALWAFASGARVRVGQRTQSFHRLLTHALDIEKSERGVLEYYCDLVRAVGATVRSTKTEYTTPEELNEWAREVVRQHRVAGKRIIAVHPGASGAYKMWDPNLYAELIDRLSSQGTVLLLGGKTDDPMIEAIKALLPSGVVHIHVDWHGKVAALLQQCALCISNDSGPRHLAVAVGTPSLALFRRYHDREWGVYEESGLIATLSGKGVCPACPPNTCLDRIPSGEKFASYCMRMIRVEEVVAKATEMLAS